VDLQGGIIPTHCFDCSVPSDSEDPPDDVMDGTALLRRHRMARGIHQLMKAVRRRRDVLFDTRCVSKGLIVFLHHFHGF